MVFPPSNSTKANYSEPICKIPVSSRVFATAFSRGADYQDAFLALGFKNNLEILQVRHDENELESGVFPVQIKVQPWRKINHNTRVQCIAWPYNSSTGFVSLATGGADGKVRYFRLHPQNTEEAEIQVLEGHNDYVNDVAFEPETGEIIASGSDDCCLIIYKLTTGEKQSFNFSSPVMFTSWHPSEGSKLMAAEKKGRIHFFNTTTNQPIMSFDTPSGILSSADWCMKNSLLVMTSVHSDVMIWDISKPSTPIYKKCLHEDGIRYTKFSNHNEGLVATSGQPNYSVKVFNTKSSQVLFSGSDKPVGGMSWHPRLGYLAIGRDESVTIHYISST